MHQKEVAAKITKAVTQNQRRRCSRSGTGIGMRGWYVYRLAPVSALEPARIAPGGFKELGLVNWAIAKLGARAIRAPRFSLFNVLGQHRLLFLAWLPYSAMLLGMLSKLPVRDAEVVILRVGHLRNC